MRKVFLLFLVLCNGAVIADDIIDNNNYFIKADDGRFVFFSPEKGFILGSNHQKTSFKISRKGDVISLKSSGYYLSAQPNKRIVAIKIEADREKFKLAEVNNKYTLKSVDGAFISTSLTSGVLDLQDHAQAWESLDFINVDTYKNSYQIGQQNIDLDYFYYIKDNHNQYISFQGQFIWSGANNKTAFILNRDDTKFFIKNTTTQDFMSARPDKSVLSEPHRQNWESFSFEPANNTNFIIRSRAHGTCVIAGGLGGPLQLGNQQCALFSLEPIDVEETPMLQVLYRKSREEWKNFAGQAAQDLISHLGSQKASFSSVNKAHIYEAGLKRLDKLIDDSKTGVGNAHSDIISIITSQGGYFPMDNTFSVTSSPQLAIKKEWMNYSDIAFMATMKSQNTQVTFGNFSNYRLGGGYSHGGNTQEEQQAHQCPDFFLILSYFNPTYERAKLHTRRNTVNFGDKEIAKYASVDSAAPILLTNVRCLQKLQGAYEKDTNKIYGSEWDMSLALKETLDAPEINQIAFTAPELHWHQKGKPYSALMTWDLFNNAYTAFALTKKYDKEAKKYTHILSGRWGAGAFGHNWRMTLAVQYLAARLALDNDDMITFTGIEDNNDSREVIQVVDQLIAAHFVGGAVVNPRTMLASLLAMVGNNPGWVIKS